MLNTFFPGLLDIPKHLFYICFGKWVWGLLFDHFSSSVHTVIYDPTSRADQKYKNVDKKLTVLLLLSTLLKSLAAHPARLSISTHFFSAANFSQQLTEISTYPCSSKHRNLSTQKGAGGSPAPTRKAMHVEAHPQTIIVDHFFLSLDMNNEAQLTFV